MKTLKTTGQKTIKDKKKSNIWRNDSMTWCCKSFSSPQVHLQISSGENMNSFSVKIDKMNQKFNWKGKGPQSLDGDQEWKRICHQINNLDRLLNFSNSENVILAQGHTTRPTNKNERSRRKLTTGEQWRCSRVWDGSGGCKTWFQPHTTHKLILGGL